MDDARIDNHAPLCTLGRRHHLQLAWALHSYECGMLRLPRVYLRSPSQQRGKCLHQLLDLLRPNHYLLLPIRTGPRNVHGVPVHDE